MTTERIIAKGSGYPASASTIFRKRFIFASSGRHAVLASTGLSPGPAGVGDSTRNSVRLSSSPGSRQHRKPFESGTRTSHRDRPPGRDVAKPREPDSVPINDEVVMSDLADLFPGFTSGFDVTCLNH